MKITATTSRFLFLGVLSAVFSLLLLSPWLVSARIVSEQLEYSEISPTLREVGFSGVWVQDIPSTTVPMSGDIRNGAITIAPYMATTTEYIVNATLVEYTTTPGLNNCFFSTVSPVRLDSPTFLILTFVSEVGGACDLDPTLHHNLRVDITGNSDAQRDLQVFGSTYDRGLPQMEDGSGNDGEPVINMFYIVDTENRVLSPNFIPYLGNIGVNATSTRAFCDTIFGTSTVSTGIFSEFAQGISSGLCNVGAFLFIPNSSLVNDFQNLATTTRQKIPFSYVVGVYDIFSDLNDVISTSTSPFPGLVLAFPDFGSTTPLGNIVPDSIVLFSTTTIGTYFSDEARNSFRNMAGLVTWLWFAFYMLALTNKLLNPNIVGS